MCWIGVYGLEVADSDEFIVLPLEDGRGRVGRSLAIVTDVVVVWDVMVIEGMSLCSSPSTCITSVCTARLASAPSSRSPSLSESELCTGLFCLLL